MFWLHHEQLQHISWSVWQGPFHRRKQDGQPTQRNCQQCDISAISDNGVSDGDLWVNAPNGVKRSARIGGMSQGSIGYDEEDKSAKSRNHTTRNFCCLCGTQSLL